MKIDLKEVGIKILTKVKETGLIFLAGIIFGIILGALIF